MQKDITIIVAALNEERNIDAALDSVIRALDGVVDDYEILVFDDGSTDRTGDLAEERARANPKIKVIRNGTNRGIGYVFAKGIQMATKSHISCFPGDNDMAAESLREIARHIGQVDLVVSYMKDMQHRSTMRRILSRAYSGLLNALFGLRLKYYNGCFLFKAPAAQSMQVRSKGFGVLAECLVKMLKMNCSYKEIAFVHTGRKAGKSTAVSLRSFASVARTLGLLVVDVYLRPAQKQSGAHGGSAKAPTTN